MKLERPVVLQVHALGVIGAEEEEGRVLGLGMAGESQGQLLGRVNVELGLVRPRAHDPVAILANPDAVACCSRAVLAYRGPQAHKQNGGDLPSSNSNSCSSSKLFRFSASYLEDLFLRRASQSGSGRAVDGPATVYLRSSVSISFAQSSGFTEKRRENNYTGTAPGFVNFMVDVDVAA